MEDGQGEIIIELGIGGEGGYMYIVQDDDISLLCVYYNILDKIFDTINLDNPLIGLKQKHFVVH